MTSKNQVAEASDAQLAFDAKYVTASEILKELKLTRSALLYARRTNKLPEPIIINDGLIYLWERNIIQPYLDAWKLILTVRRGK